MILIDSSDSNHFRARDAGSEQSKTGMVHGQIQFKESSALDFARGAAPDCGREAESPAHKQEVVR